MHSKFMPWDFFLKFPTTIDPKKPGLYAFLITDPYLERILLDRLPKKEIPTSLYSGSEITKDFLEEHFLNLSFFSELDHLQIMNAEAIPTPVISMLLDDTFDFGERFIILNFTKSSKGFSELSKNKKTHTFELEEVKFWDGPKLWQFCQKVRNVNYSSEVTRFILENLEHKFESFLWALDMIEQNFTESDVQLNELKLFIKKERWDYFSLVDIFHQSPRKFFEEILKKDDLDYEWFRGLFSFMQGHLAKVLSPEEIKMKPKPSKYDLALISMSENWTHEQIHSSIKFFSECEILAKSNDYFLFNNLRLKIL